MSPRSCMSMNACTRAAPAAARSSLSVSGPSVLNISSPSGASTRANSRERAQRIRQPVQRHVAPDEIDRAVGERQSLQVGAQPQRILAETTSARRREACRARNRARRPARGRNACRDRVAAGRSPHRGCAAARSSCNRGAPACARRPRLRAARPRRRCAPRARSAGARARRSIPGERALNRGGHREDAPVAHRRAGDHQARPARVARLRGRAA